MFLTWEEAKIKYPGKWVIFRNPQYLDIFHVNFVGGEFVTTAEDMQEMEDSIPEDGGSYAVKHTEAHNAVGLLKSGY